MNCLITEIDLVYEITEGQKTGVKQIDFVGNKAYSSYRLKDVIKTSQSNWLSFLQNSDVYDPDRLEADRDLLRRFYLNHGYADVRIVSAMSEYDTRCRVSLSLSTSMKVSNTALVRSTFNPVSSALPVLR